MSLPHAHPPQSTPSPDQGTPPQGDLERAARLIEQADALVVAAGAGMGVDSGLPDFRGQQGFWQAYPALGQARIDFTQIASPQAFAASPALAWGFYGHRLALYRDTVPHAGYALLRQWGEHMPHGCAVFTSNVDGQFQKAGFAPRLVHECHGSIHHMQCMRSCTDQIWSARDFMPDVDTDHCLLRHAPPTCPHCGGLARPNILMFGDWGWQAHRERQQAAALQKWLAQAQRPVVIELGAGTAVPSVRHFSQQMLTAHGARLIRINPREPAVPGSLDVSLPVGALQGLRALATLLSSPP
jgi:NAD-dependent SIR2 family protein deacetylase